MRRVPNTATSQVYNIANRTSFEGLNTWLKEMERHAPENVVKVVIGNAHAKPFASGGRSSPGNHPLEGPLTRQVTPEQGRALAAPYGVGFFETVPKTGEGVEEAFLSVTRGEPTLANTHQQCATELAHQTYSMRRLGHGVNWQL